MAYIEFNVFIFVSVKNAFCVFFLFLCFNIVLLMIVFWVDYLALPFISACHMRSNWSSHNSFVNFIL